MSNTVDERIVGMRFDNQQFERGVRTTLSTLGKLKQSLKFDGAATGLENVGRAARGVSFDGIAAGVDALQKRFSAFGIAGMRVIQNLTDLAMGFAKKTIGFVTDSIINGGKKRAMNIENAHFQLQGLLKDEEKVQAVMSDAMDSVDGTAYAYDEAAKAASQFAASGMEAGAEMQSSLRAITGVAAMTNSEYESISQIFTTVAGNGRLMGDQLLQLSSRGLNAAATVKDFFNGVNDGSVEASESVTAAVQELTGGLEVTEGDIREFVSSGEVSFQMFAAAMDNAFGEHAKKANETFTGALSNVKASLARIGAEFVSPLIVQNGSLVQALNALRERINDVKANIGPLAKMFTDSVTGMADAATKYLSGLDLTKHFEAFYNVVDVLKNILGGIASELKPIGQAFRDIFPPVAIDAVVNFTAKLKELTANFKTSDKKAADIRNTFKGLFAVLDIIGRAVGSVLSALSPVIKVLDSLGWAILSVTGRIGEWLASVDQALKENEAFKKAAQKMHDVLDRVFKPVCELLNMAADAVREFAGLRFGAPDTSLVENFSDRLKARFEPLGKLGEVVKTAMDKIVEAFKKVSPVLSKIGDMISDAFIDVCDRILDGLRGDGFDPILDLFNSGMVIGVGTAIMKFIGSLQKSVEKFSGIFSGVNGILSEVKNTLRSYQASLKADVLMKIAGAVAVLAASLFVLSLIDSDKLSGALAAISVLFGELAASMAVFSKTLSGSKGLAKAGFTMMEMSVGVLILASALKKVAGIDPDKLAGALAGITVLIGELVAASLALSKWGGKMKTSAVSMVLFAEAVYILAKAVAKLSELDTDQLVRGLSGVGILLGELAAFMFAAKFGSFKASQGLAVLELAAALLILEKAVEAFGNMDIEVINKGLSGVGAVLAEVAAFSEFMGREKKLLSTATALTIIGAAMLIFGKAIKDIGGLSVESIGKGLLGIGGALAAVAASVRFMPKNMVAIGLGLMVLAAALKLIGDVIRNVGGMEWEDIGKGLLALGSSLGILAVALHAMKGTLGAASSLLVMSAALSVFVPVMKAFGSMSLAEIGKAILMLASAFTVLGIAGAVIGPIIPAILGLAGAMALIGVAALACGVGLLAFSAGLASLAVSGVAGAMALVSVIEILIVGILNAITKSAEAIADAVKTIVLIAVNVVVGCASVIVEGVLTLIEEVLLSLASHGPEIAAYLMDFLIGVIDAVGERMPQLIQAAEKLIGNFFRGVIDALKKIDTTTFLESLACIGLITALMFAFAAVASLIPAAMVGVLGMGAVIAELSLVLAAIGAFAQIPGLKWLIGEGGDLLQEVGIAIGKFVGGIIGGMVSGVSSQFPQVGKDLSAFMDNIQPFIEGAGKIKAQSMDGVKALAQTILVLTAANVLDGMTKWLTGGSSMTKFGEELAEFGPYLKKFADSVDGLNGDVVTNSANAAKTLSEMASNLPNQGGVAGWFAGENSLAAFAEELVEFGPALKKYADSVDGLDAEDVVNSANAAKALAEMADNLPNQGGVVGWFAGENNLSLFATELAEFGPYLKKYADSVDGLNGNAVTNSASAAKTLAEFANSLPNQGGVVSWFTGDNTLSVFGEELEKFGPHLKRYADSVDGLGVEAVVNSANAAKALAEMADNLPNQSGFASLFTGNTLSVFGEELARFGPHFKRYADSIDGLGVDAVVSSANAAEALAEMAEVLPNTGGLASLFTGEGSLSLFGEELAKFGPHLKRYADSIDGIGEDAVVSSANAAKALAEMTEVLPNTGGLVSLFTGAGSLSLFGEELAKFGPHLKRYADSVDGMKEDVVVNSANGAKALAELANNLPNTGGLAGLFAGNNDIGVFGESLEQFGKSLAAFYQSVSGIETSQLGGVISGLQEILDFADGMSGLKQSLEDIGNDSINGFIQAFANADSKITKAASDVATAFINGVKSSQSSMVDIFSKTIEKAITEIRDSHKNFTLEGNTVIAQFIDGIKGKSGEIKPAVSSTLKDALAGIQEKQQEFYSAGSYLVDGFVKGIGDNAFKASLEAKAMASDALRAARDELGVHSPSTVFAEIGGYVVDGFTNGIYSNRYKAAHSAEGLAKVGVEAAQSVARSLKDSNSVFADFVDKTDANGNAVEITLEKAADAFKSFRDSVKESIESATGVFDAFEVETDITGKQILKNLSSQITGIAEWASNIQLLAARGIDQGLLKVLSDMGPSGAKYVSALVTMSDKELKKLNSLYRKRIGLNGKAADEIAASFVEGGKKSADGYTKGFKGVTGVTRQEMRTEGRVVIAELTNGSVAAVEEMGGKLQEALGWSYKDAVKEAKSGLDYGKGAFQQFTNEYLKSTKNVTLGNKAINAASKAITAYGKKLYEESEYYKEDTANLNKHKKELTKLQNKRKSLQKDLKKAQKSNSAASKTRVKTLKQELDANNKSISDAKKKIKDDEKEIAKHTKEVFNNLRSTLSESVSAFLDPLKVSLESGVDLFKKFESNTDLYEADKKNLEKHQKSLKDLEATQKSIQDEINKYAGQNTLAARQRVKGLKKQLSEVESSIEEAKKNIEQAENDMASHSGVTVDSILENMQSQVNGVKKWQQNLKKLAGRGLAQGLLDKLKEMGPEGAEYVDQFMKMTSAELKKANDLFAQSENLTSQTLIDNFKDNLNLSKAWADGLQDLAKMGFSQDLIEKLGSMGVEGYDYVKAFLSMTPAQVKQFNRDFSDSLKLPDKIADQVISSFAYAGGQSIAGFTDALAKLAKDGTDENKALVATAAGISKVIEKPLKTGSNTSGKNAVAALAKGIKDKKKTAVNSSTLLGNETIKPLKNVLSAKSGGKVAGNIVRGLKNGLSDGESGVSKMAKKVARSAYDAAKKELGIKSPSKAFAELGKYTDAGFVKGLMSGEDGIYKTATGIMGQAIQEVADTIQSDIDAQPTIRPVMDLTDIQNGTGRIGEMLDGYAVSGSVGLAGMTAKDMSGYTVQSDDLMLDAIRKLQNTLSGFLDEPRIEQNNTFSISGSDPKEIADEVSHILQQQVERRSAVWA